MTKEKVTSPADPMLYLAWFVDQYDVGLPNESTMQSSIAYLQGMIDSVEPDRRSYLFQAQTQLRSLEVIVRTLKQYQVRMPHG